MRVECGEVDGRDALACARGETVDKGFETIIVNHNLVYCDAEKSASVDGVSPYHAVTHRRHQLLAR